MKEQKLIIIRGASGVGKSTALQHFKEKLEDAFLIDIDSIRTKFSRMDWVNGVTDFINAQFITKAMVKEALNLGYGWVLVADPFPVSLLEQFTDGINCDICVISLYCDDEELLRRLETRGRPILHREKIFKLNDEIRNRDLDDSGIKAGHIFYVDNTSQDENTLDSYI